MNNLSGKVILSNCLCLHSEKRSIIKGKNLLPKGENVLLLEQIPFQKGLDLQEQTRKSAKLSHSRTEENLQLVRLINPFMPSGIFYHNSFDRSFCYIRGVWLVFIIIMFCRNS